MSTSNSFNVDNVYILNIITAVSLLLSFVTEKGSGSKPGVLTYDWTKNGGQVIPRHGIWRRLRALQESPSPPSETKGDSGVKSK